MSANEFVEAQASNLSKAQVFALAESIATQLEYRPGDDVRTLVERIGGSVSVADTLTTDPTSSGSLYVHGPNKFSIIVPSHTSALRDRFTIAHELGHFIVHYLYRKKSGAAVPDKMIAFRRGSERVEWEANWFAAAFLMPEKEFRTQYFAHGRDVDAVASKFQVSSSAAEIRARQLSLT